MIYMIYIIYMIIMIYLICEQDESEGWTFEPLHYSY